MMAVASRRRAPLTLVGVESAASCVSLMIFSSFPPQPRAIIRRQIANPKGVVTKYGEVQPNGIILSANEKVIYVTNGATLAAFDVQADGSLTNQREFAKLEGGGNGDGSTIDAAGRIYVTTNPGVQVISPEGKYLGIIPTPRGVITTAFGGKDKKTLFILARGAKDSKGEEVANAAQIYAIEMIAQGYKGRAK